MPLALKTSQQQEQSQKLQGPSLPCQSTPNSTEVGGDGVSFLPCTGVCAAGRAVRLPGKPHPDLVFMPTPADTRG